MEEGGKWATLQRRVGPIHVSSPPPWTASVLLRVAVTAVCCGNFVPYVSSKESEGFSSLLCQASSSSSLFGVQLARSAPLVTHFLFAHDNMIFAEVTTGAASIKSILHTYSQCSGKLLTSTKKKIEMRFVEFWL
ncbi:hypothetical protein V6N13_139948 [Hibiscus sabdariffa]